MDSIYWLIALAVLLIIEIMTMGLTTIWFAGGSLVAFIASMLGANLPIQIVLFCAVSFVLLFFTRPIAMKYFNNNRTKTNYESLIGKEGRVIEDIDNFEGTGSIVVNGQEWTARSTEGQKILKETKVTIINISGVKLIVSE